ncbi:hypothetical protein [Hymenobacter rubripertinctus]|uniref:hypothetical protein n=1 Tax=Hymenobacter rubripertinctus TaxID=2029981 RepID=UPI0011C3449D|nr:hypothetical protein [Hymenobacter rubripertinctus]
MKDLIKKMEDCWEVDTGFLYFLREGIFHHDLYVDFINSLKEIEAFEDLVPSRLVTLLWYISPFIEWQRDRVTNSISLDEYDIIVIEIQNQLERILGIP